jgi:sulfur carrier protein ThiS
LIYLNSNAQPVASPAKKTKNWRYEMEGNIRVTMIAGSGNEVEIELPAGTTASLTTKLPIVRSIVDLGDRGLVVINGAKVSPETALRDGDVVEVVSKSNDKG